MNRNWIDGMIKNNRINGMIRILGLIPLLFLSSFVSHPTNSYARVADGVGFYEARPYLVTDEETEKSKTRGIASENTTVDMNKVKADLNKTGKGFQKELDKANKENW